MNTKVSISNLALMKIGADMIMDFSDEAPEADACRTLFDSELDTLLQETKWNFAIYKQGLPVLDTAPLFDYDYAYSLPVDPYCLRVLRVENDTNFIVQGRTLLSDESSVSIEYIKRVTDMSELSPLFVDAFVYKLAASISFLLRGSSAQHKEMLQSHIIQLKKAAMRDAQEGKKAKTLTIGSWRSAR